MVHYIRVAARTALHFLRGRHCRSKQQCAFFEETVAVIENRRVGHWPRGDRTEDVVLQVCKFHWEYRIVRVAIHDDGESDARVVLAEE